MMSSLSQSNTSNATQELPDLADEHLSESLRVLPEGIQIDQVPPLVALNKSKSRQRSASAGTNSDAYATALFLNRHSSGSNSERKKRYTTITASKIELQDWIEMLLEIKFEYPFFEQLKRGTILCELLNSIKPGTCSKYQQSDRIYIQKRNVSIYLSGCRSLGIHKNHLFVVNDLVSDYQLRSNQRKIITNLRHVSRIANKLQLKQTPSEMNDVHDVFDDDEDLGIVVIDTPVTKKSIRKNKFKLKDYSLSMSGGSPTEISISSGLKRSCSQQDTMFHFVSHCYLDTQSDRSKELVIAGYFHEYEHIDASIVKTIGLFVIGDVASLYWTLYSQTIDDFLEEEEDILQYEKRLVLGNGSIVLEIAISHNDDVLTMSIDNVNSVQLIAYCYCKCMNNKRVIKHVYNSMHGEYNMDMDVIDIIAWREQNASEFKTKFLELNNNTKKAATYYRIPHFDETLKLMFYIEVISLYNNVNINKNSEYKWNLTEKVSSDEIFENFEIYSDNFGDDAIEYDKCWTLVAKYSDFYEQFYFALKLLKLPMKIEKLTVKCCLTMDEVSYPKTQDVDLNKNCIEFDEVWANPKCIHQKTVNVSIEIIEASDIESHCIPETDWKDYGIN